MAEHIEVSGTFETLQASSILALAKGHKKNCDGKCGISLFALFPLYKKLKGDSAVTELENFI